MQREKSEARDQSFLEKPQRRPEKQKKPIGENVVDSRFERISFKRYLRELDENIEDDDFVDDDAVKLPTNQAEIAEMVEQFTAANKALCEDITKALSIEKGVENLTEELKIDLQQRGHISSTLDSFFSKYENQLYEHFFNWITK